MADSTRRDGVTRIWYGTGDSGASEPGPARPRDGDRDSLRLAIKSAMFGSGLWAPGHIALAITGSNEAA